MTLPKGLPSFWTCQQKIWHPSILNLSSVELTQAHVQNVMLLRRCCWAPVSNRLIYNFFRWYGPVVVSSVIILIVFVIMYIKLYREFGKVYNYNANMGIRMVRSCFHKFWISSKVWCKQDIDAVTNLHGVNELWNAHGMHLLQSHSTYNYTNQGIPSIRWKSLH